MAQIIFNCLTVVFLGFLSIIWTKKTFLNIFIKMFLIGMTLFGITLLWPEIMKWVS